MDLDSMAYWSEVPYDILRAIALKLDELEDLVSFSAVCRWWNNVYLRVKKDCRFSTPWLLLAEKWEHHNPHISRKLLSVQINRYYQWSISRKLFSVYTNRCYRWKLAEAFGRKCWGSTNGWIVTLSLDGEIHLFNPLSKARLCLPHQSTLPNPSEEDRLDPPGLLGKLFVTRAIALQIQDNNNLVVVVYGKLSYLAFVRPGDQVWTPIGTEDLYRERSGASDVCCYCHNKILILFGDGSLGWCDITSPDAEVSNYLPAPQRIFHDNNLNKLYLVSSFGGDLLIVLRHKKKIRDVYKLYKTTRFDVFRPNFHTKEWEEVTDLGDVALFVGDNCSTAVSISQPHNCRCNQVYFTDDEYQLRCWPRDYGGHDMGAYDMKSREIVPFYKGAEVRSQFCTPFWFIPKF